MSVWHTPHASRRTSTSPARGSASSTSCTWSGWPNSSSTAAPVASPRPEFEKRSGTEMKMRAARDRSQHPPHHHHVSPRADHRGAVGAPVDAGKDRPRLGTEAGSRAGVLAQGEDPVSYTHLTLP